MQAESYREFSLRVHQNADSGRLPLEATIEVTRRCPLTCAHCYNNLPMDDRAARCGELTYEEHCRILDEITEAGCLWLLYTGGEIFARPDFLEIYGYARRKGLLITLFTNGTLITPRIADYLAQWRPFSIEITLYGATRETYERLTGAPGSHDRCMRGIRLLKERGLPLKLKTVAVSVNRHEIGAMKRLADELGVEFMFDAMMNPRVDCSQAPLAVRLRPEEVVRLDLEDPARRAGYRRLGEYYVRPAMPSEQSDEVYFCGGGMRSFAIDPRGRMSICVISHFDEYDLRSGGFKEGWEGFLQRVRRKKITRRTKCADCGIKVLCGMCPANGELENGDPESPVAFHCEVAHLRAHALGFQVPPHTGCEYCPGGERYEDLLRAAAGLSEERAAAPAAAPLVRLPVLSGAGCASGGCAGCAGASAV
jgi:radical SAM protein with 4Fe4S-binding SPASM domain